MRAVTKRFIVYNLITSVLSAVTKAKNLIGDVPKWLKGPHSKWSTRLFVLSTSKSSSHAGLSQFKKVNILLFCPVVLSSVFFRISGLTYGELSEWSKVQHSKCCVPKRNLGFESLTLRQTPKVQTFGVIFLFSPKFQ